MRLVCRSRQGLEHAGFSLMAARTIVVRYEKIERESGIRTGTRKRYEIRCSGKTLKHMLLMDRKYYRDGTKSPATRTVTSGSFSHVPPRANGEYTGLSEFRNDTTKARSRAGHSQCPR